jgi:phosphotransferase system  glucose/maltose/N-acetylglucosamine-specific IIC component
MMPGTRYARILMVIVAIVVTAGLIVGVVAAPTAP